MRFFVPGFFALLFFSIPAQAEIVVPANKTMVMYDFAVWFQADCSFPGKPRFKVNTQPKHGKLALVYDFTKVKNLPDRCKGKVKGLQAVYTPNRGYRGPDNYVLTVFQPRFLNDAASRGHTVRANFTVR